MGERPIAEAFILVAELAKADGAAPLNARTDCWVRRLDDNWTIAVNGTDRTLECKPDGTMGAGIEPFHMAVWWNGWLAGLLHPYGGVIAAGSAANEESFVAAIRAAIGKARGTP